MAKRRWLSRVTGYNGGHDAFQGLRFPIFPGQPSRLAAAGNNNEINLISSRRSSTLHVLDPADTIFARYRFHKNLSPLFLSRSLSLSLIDLTNPVSESFPSCWLLLLLKISKNRNPRERFSHTSQTFITHVRFVILT